MSTIKRNIYVMVDNYEYGTDMDEPIEEEWRIDFTYTPGYRGSFEEAPYAGEYDFQTATNESTKETLKFNRFCELFKINEQDIVKWEESAYFDMAEDLYYGNGYEPGEGFDSSND